MEIRSNINSVWVLAKRSTSFCWFSDRKNPSWRHRKMQHHLKKNKNKSMLQQISNQDVVVQVIITSTLSPFAGLSWSPLMTALHHTAYILTAVQPRPSITTIKTKLQNWMYFHPTEHNSKSLWSAGAASTADICENHSCENIPWKLGKKSFPLCVTSRGI